jgi:hypothetical protein
MSRLSRNGWSLSQLIEEWNYHRDERLGILCGSTEPEPWMVRLAEQDGDRAVKRLLREQGMLITEKIQNQSEV